MRWNLSCPHFFNTDSSRLFWESRWKHGVSLRIIISNFTTNLSKHFYLLGDLVKTFRGISPRPQCQLHLDWYASLLWLTTFPWLTSFRALLLELSFSPSLSIGAPSFIWLYLRLIVCHHLWLWKKDTLEKGASPTTTWRTSALVLKRETPRRNSLATNRQAFLCICSLTSTPHLHSSESTTRWLTGISSWSS